MRLLKKKPRRAEPCGKLELEKVIGLTTTHASGFASNFSSGDFVYLAGCVVVVYNVERNCQVRFLVASRTPKALTCVAYSHHGGKFIAAGESGHQPAVIIWDSLTGSCIADLKAHKYGVSCVEFSPNGKHLVSVGFPHDGFLCLWDWRSGTLVAKVRATTAVAPITAVHFSSDGSYFLTAGTKHLKHWTVGAHTGRRSTAGIGTLAVDGKPVNLGSQKESSFVSVSSAAYFKSVGVAAGQSLEIQPIYVLTTAGILCLLHSGVAIKKWVDLKVQQGYGLAVSELHVACACSNGIVRLFMLDTLVYAGTLPKPAPHGYHGIKDEKVCSSFSVAHNAQNFNFPDAIACSFSASQKLAVIYGDHSLYVWDVHNLSKVTRCYAFLSHSACIWDITNLPTYPKWEIVAPVHNVGEGSGVGAFATCSADGTVRLWDLTLGTDAKEPQSDALVFDSKSANVFSKDVLGVIYSDRMGEPMDKQAESEESIDLAQGFRSLAVSADGQYLAAGDRSGNLRVYDLNSLDLKSFQEAHDAEILSLNFSTVSEKTAGGKGPQNQCLLASGGRDRLIHVYDVERDFDVIETLDDHSASITTVKFACHGSKLLSCSADKSVVFRNVSATDSGCKSTRYHQEVASRGTIYDMDIDPANKLAVTVGQDKKINVLSLITGKPVRSFKQDGDVGEPIKVRVDQTGSYLICSHADKCMRVYDFMSGEVVAQASGHAEVITGASFLPDCRHVISVSGDSCIFIWKLPTALSRAIRKKHILYAESHSSANSCSAKLQSEDVPGQDALCSQLVGDPIEPIQDNSGEADHNLHKALSDTPQDAGSVEPSAFKFSISRLPKWAQTKVMDGKLTTLKTDGENVEQNVFHSAESRWAERLGTDGYCLFAEIKEDKTPPATIRPVDFGARRRFTLEGQSSYPESTPESSFGSHIDVSPASPKGQQSVRKDTHWRTVHTVFFDELEFLQEDHSEGNLLPLSMANKEKFEQITDSNANIQSQPGSSIADPSSSEMQHTLGKGNIASATTSEDEQERKSSDEKVKANQCCNTYDKDDQALSQYKTPPPSGSCSIPDDEGIGSNSSKLECMGDCCLQVSHAAESNSGNNLQSHYNKMFMADVSSAEDESDDEFSPNKDLFSMHFGRLSTAVKLETGTASARSSFSTRFFARTSCSLARTSLFQTSPRENGASVTDSSETIYDQDMCIDAASLLATERERLKQLERQGKVVHEVQNMPDNFVPHEQLMNESVVSVLKNATTGVGGSEIHDAANPNESFGNQLHNSMPRSLPSSSDCKASLVNLDVGVKDKLECAFGEQHGETNTLEDSQTEHEIVVPHIAICTECEEDLDQACPRSSRATLLLLEVSDESIEEPMRKVCVCANGSKEPDTNDRLEVLEHCSVKSLEGLAVDARDPMEKDTGEIDRTMLPIDLPGKSGKVVMELPRSLEEYEAALKNLSDAAEKALNLFTELRLEDKYPTVDTICLRSSSDLSDLAHGLIPTTLERVQKLCDLAFSDQLYESRQNTFRGSMSTGIGEKPAFNFNNGELKWNTG
eukprot:Gb_06105 [translate_table: standard]